MPITQSIYQTPIEQTYRSVQKFGSSFELDTAGIPEDIWTPGGLYPFPTSALTTTVVSDDAADTAAGTGAQGVRVQGLDANWNFVEQAVLLNGLTPVELPTPLLRCFRANIVPVGSTGTNAGNITILHGATVIAQLDAGIGQTLMAIYTVPADFGTMNLSRFYASVGKQSAVTAEVDIFFRLFEEGWRSFTRMDLHSQGSSEFEHRPTVDISAPPKTDIRVTCTFLSANNTSISAGFDLQGKR